MDSVKMYDKELLKNTLVLQELSECCVCMLGLRPAHSLCSTGHGVCAKCKSVLSECPMCKGSFVLDNAVLLNQILELLPRSCTFYNRGCAYAGCGNNHEQFCMFRPSQCRMVTCDFAGSVKDVVDHVRAEHKDKVMEMSPDSKKSGVLLFSNASSYAVCYTPVFYEGNFFWKYLLKDRAKRVLTHAFYHVPFAQPDKSYILKVEFDKVKENLSCIAQTEAFDQNCDIPETVVETKLDSTEKSDNLNLEVPESVPVVPEDPEISNELSVNVKEEIPKAKEVQKPKILAKIMKRTEDNDVSISTKLLSRKLEKKGGNNCFKYKYSVSIEEKNIMLDE